MPNFSNSRLKSSACLIDEMVAFSSPQASGRECVANDLHKIGFNACPADESAVNIGMSDKLTDIDRGHTTAVKNMNSLSGFGTIHSGIVCTNKMNDPASVFDIGSAPGADGPDRFIG